MTIEEYVIGKLKTALALPTPAVSVSGEVPRTPPTVFVTVEKTGSAVSDRIRSATLVIQSWAGSQADASALNERVKAAMEALLAQPEVSRIHCDTDYNFPDETTKHHRYAAVFDVVHYL